MPKQATRIWARYRTALGVYGWGPFRTVAEAEQHLADRRIDPSQTSIEQEDVVLQDTEPDVEYWTPRARVRKIR